MIIVSGRIYLAPGTVVVFLEESYAAIRSARRAHGCRDFVVAADPLEPNRVNVYEEWESESDLELFRGDGPTDTLAVSIVRIEVTRYHVTSSGPA